MLNIVRRCIVSSACALSVFRSYFNVPNSTGRNVKRDVYRALFLMLKKWITPTVMILGRRDRALDVFRLRRGRTAVFHDVEIAGLSHS